MSLQEDKLARAFAQRNSTMMENFMKREKAVKDTTVADPSKNYIRAVENWALRTKQSVEIKVERLEQRRGEKEQRVVAKVVCSATPSCICAYKLVDETIVQCKQRAARNFLSIHHNSPFGARR